MHTIAIAITAVAAVFAVGFALGEAHVVKRLKAEAECPDGRLYRKVVDLKKMEIHCHYYATPGEK